MCKYEDMNMYICIYIYITNIKIHMCMYMYILYTSAFSGQGSCSNSEKYAGVTLSRFTVVLTLRFCTRAALQARGVEVLFQLG